MTIADPIFGYDVSSNNPKFSPEQAAERATSSASSAPRAGWTSGATSGFRTATAPTSARCGASSRPRWCRAPTGSPWTAPTSR